MAASARSIASLTLSFGLVNVPVRLFSATEPGADIRFNLLAKDGSRLKQQYEALRQSGRCALARWSWKAKQYVAQVRANADGLILQQRRYAAEVRSLHDLGIPKATVTKPELQLALQLVDQIAADGFDPARIAEFHRRSSWQTTGRGRAAGTASAST